MTLLEKIRLKQNLKAPKQESAVPAVPVQKTPKTPKPPKTQIPKPQSQTQPKKPRKRTPKEQLANSRYTPWGRDRNHGWKLPDNSVLDLVYSGADQSWSGMLTIDSKPVAYCKAYTVFTLVLNLDAARLGKQLAPSFPPPGTAPNAKSRLPDGSTFRLEHRKSGYPYFGILIVNGVKFESSSRIGLLTLMHDLDKLFRDGVSHD